MKKLLLFLFITLLSCNQGQKMASEDERMQIELDSMDMVVEDLRREKDSVIDSHKRWNYLKHVDEMDGQVTKQAIIYSQNAKELEFPYDSAQAILSVAKIEEKEFVGFTISEGQLNPESNSNVTIRLKFDNNPPVNYKFEENNDIIRMYNSAQIISELEKSDSLMVELDFYREGKEIFHFYTTGFDRTKLN